MVNLKEVKNMFWALVLEPGKRYSQTVEQSFHMSMAALDLSTDADGHKNRTVSVMGSTDKGDFLLCSLNSKGSFQQPLDLNFNEGEEITFYVSGDGTVHLTGYQIEDEPDFNEMLGADSDDEDEVPELLPAGVKRKDIGEPSVGKKKTKWLTVGGSELSDDDSEDSDYEQGEEDDDDDEDDDDMDDLLDDTDFIDMEADSDDQDDDESDEEEPTPVKKGKTPNKQQQTPGKNDKKQTPAKATPANKTPAKATPANKKPETPAAGPGGDASSASAKKKKKKKNKGEDAANGSPKTPAPTSEKKVESGGDATSEQSAKKKKKKKKKSEAQSPANGTPKPAQPQETPKGKQQQQSKTPRKQVLPGGCIAEDINAGDGDLARKGKMVHVYYVGKLQSNGKQFDSCTKGKPFRFRLGKGEVIKGWESGIEGMKIGGKRRLTVPPQAGYGNQRSGPIPPNSTLVFEVELKNIT